MNSFKLIKFTVLLISIGLINCQQRRSIQSTVKEHLYDLSEELEQTHNLQVENAYHRTISVFGKEYHFYNNGQVEKGELYAIGLPDKTIEHEPTRITELEFDDFLNEIEKPSNIQTLKSSNYWDDEYGSYQIALVFLKPGIGDDDN